MWYNEIKLQPRALDITLCHTFNTTLNCSQDITLLRHIKFQLLSPSKELQTSPTLLFFCVEIKKRRGKRSQKRVSDLHLSFQKLVLIPSPILLTTSEQNQVGPLLSSNVVKSFHHRGKTVQKAFMFLCFYSPSRLTYLLGVPTDISRCQTVGGSYRNNVYDMFISCFRLIFINSPKTT